MHCNQFSTSMCITLWKRETAYDLSCMNSEIFTTMHRVKCGMKCQESAFQSLCVGDRLAPQIRTEVAIVLVWRGEIAARQTALPTRTGAFAGARPSAHPCRPGVGRRTKG